jgi:hypothetical protein
MPNPGNPKPLVAALLLALVLTAWCLAGREESGDASANSASTETFATSRP